MLRKFGIGLLVCILAYGAYCVFMGFYWAITRYPGGQAQAQEIKPLPKCSQPIQPSARLEAQLRLVDVHSQTAELLNTWAQLEDFWPEYCTNEMQWSSIGITVQTFVLDYKIYLRTQYPVTFGFSCALPHTCVTTFKAWKMQGWFAKEQTQKMIEELKRLNKK